MVSNTTTIKHEVGLHARPAAIFVREAQQFKSTLTLEFNGQKVNAKSLLAILTLGVGHGAQVTITANGEDETQAVQALEKIIEDNFGE